MKKSSERAASALENVGLTALEARIYVNLLENGPMTGYRIAQHVGKAAANTYKALETLSTRGLAACEDGATRLYRATPFAEVSAALADDFSRRARDASIAVAAIQRDRSDDRVYRLHGAAQIYQRARTLIAGAKSAIALDAFPDALEALAPAIADAAKRGIAVSVHAYAPVQLPGTRVVIAANAAAIRRHWPGTWLNVSTDGACALIAHILDDHSTVGVWTENAYVAWTFHCGLASETAMAALSELAEREPGISLADGLRSIAGILNPDLPGRSALVSRLSKKKGRRS